MVEQNTAVENVETTEVLKAIPTVKGWVVYEFTEQSHADNATASLTEEVLAEHKFVPCGKFDQFKAGMMPFDGEGESYILKAASSIMLQVTTQKKVPHKAKVKKLCKIAEKKYQVENDIDKLDKETKDIIKLTVIESLLPETTADEAVNTLLWFTGKYLIVGAGSYNKAEELVSTLRLALDTLPVTPLEVDKDVTDQLTNMLAKNYDENLVLLNLVHLVNPEEKGVIKFEKQRLAEVDCKNHLQDGCVVSKMQITLDYDIDFTLNTDLEFSGVRISKEVTAGTADLGSVIVTVAEINKVVNEVVKVFSDSAKVK